MNSSSQLYDNSFYDAQMTGSYRSAKLYAAIFQNLFCPESVVDIGCGRGTWLKAFKELGTKRIVGFDGEWNTADNLVENSIEFTPCNLNLPIKSAKNEKFGLAMSLEVAEHLEPSSADSFVQSLTELSDVVLFGAAFTGQGGTNHINERPHSYWASLFLSRGYLPFDIFRQAVWGNPNIEWWYQQNTFLYVRETSVRFADLMGKGAKPLINFAFMDCIHPMLFRTMYSLAQNHADPADSPRQAS